VAAGGDVIAHDLDADRGWNTVQSEFGDHRATFIAMDLAMPSNVPMLWKRAVEWRGRIDILVNNAGIYEEARVDDTFENWESSWTRTLAINLISAAHLCREAIRHFVINGGGRIINIASRAGFRGDGPDYMHYAASKGGILALTRTIARGYAAQNILAYGVAPGFVRTELNADFFRRNGEGIAIAETPLGEIAEPADIASVVAFLASDLARHATGTTIDVNGASYVR
jgi:NAD(P)-dependent dehydrogenase (short-subunit alcohol dehydrogenase family)